MNIIAFEKSHIYMSHIHIIHYAYIIISDIVKLKTYVRKKKSITTATRND